MARPDKEATVAELAEKLTNAKSVVVTDYMGLDVAEITELRKRLREAGVEYKVVKNTLARLAAKQAGIETITDFFVGPTAIAFGIEDAVSPAKILVDFSEDHDELEIKGGALNGEIINIDKVKSLAKIPPRDVLLAKALAGMKAPISGLVNVLQGNLRGLVQVLNQIKEQKA
ncbi:MAG: large subunit ribosomal protein [Halanaerobiales bacterium]|nr:large subunit ribosomal protein [Halanaerobiales bacterium]